MKSEIAPKPQKRRRWPRVLGLSMLAVVLTAVLLLAWCFNLLPVRYYSAADFDIVTLRSPVDYNQNGVDDYTDILEGARIDARNYPRYDDAYHEGGYPPDNVGVCTDLVWRALAHAGYDLKALVDADIAAHPQLYPGLDAAGPDPNIDFRRVRNLKVFFERHLTVLTLDITDTAAWQPGDIIIFSGGSNHIGIISDRRNKDGIPWLIHNTGQPRREEDTIEKLLMFKEITGHYRWDYTE